MSRWPTILGTLCLAFMVTLDAFCQKTLTIKRDPPSAFLFDQFGVENSERRSGRFDSLFTELVAKPNSIGYVFLFCGKICPYGEIEAHLRGIEVKVRFRRFDRNRLIVLNGGYRESFETEFWLVPAGAGPPTPKSTVSIKDVTFKGLRKSFIEPYDCCDDPMEMWNELKKN